MPAKRAWLIDASIYIFRAWFSLPDRWHSAEGMPLNALYGYVSFLLDFLEASEQPRHCAAAFDESLGTCFRNDLLPGYKASRELPDEALAFQLEACRHATECLGIPCYSGERYEADDYLGSLARVCRSQGMNITIVTRDKDLGQILSDDADHWWDFASGTTLNPRAFSLKHGVRPDQFAEYLALVGDPIDDVPGIPGVGPKSAVALLQAFESLEGIEANFDQISALDIRGAKSLQSKVQDHWPQVRLALQLTRLEQDVPGVTEPPEFELRNSAVQQLLDYLHSLPLQGPLLRRCEKLAGSLSQ